MNIGLWDEVDALEAGGCRIVLMEHALAHWPGSAAIISKEDRYYPLLGAIPAGRLETLAVMLPSPDDALHEAHFEVMFDFEDLGATSLLRVAKAPPTSVLQNGGFYMIKDIASGRPTNVDLSVEVAPAM